MNKFKKACQAPARFFVMADPFIGQAAQNRAVFLITGANGTVQVQLFQVDETWRVNGFNFQVE